MLVFYTFLSCFLMAVQGRHPYREGSRYLYGGGGHYSYPLSDGGYENQIPSYYSMIAAQSAASASANVMAASGSASASASASSSIVGLQSRWTETHSYCNDVLGRVANFISKIEEVSLGLPLTIIKAALGIPSDVVKLAISLAESLLPNLARAKELLEGFFQTVFDVPAKALYGTVSIFFDMVNKILDWGQTCHRAPVCPNPLPSVGGYGPCGGQWPCTRVTACQTASCLNAARTLQAEAVRSDAKEVAGVTSKSRSAKPKRNS